MSDIVKDNRGAMQKVRAECIADAGLGQWFDSRSPIRLQESRTTATLSVDAPK